MKINNIQKYIHIYSNFTEDKCADKNNYAKKTLEIRTKEW